jgi:hypothetical protein
MIMETLSDIELCSVTGGAQTYPKIQGTTIFHTPDPKDVCDPVQHKYLEEHIGKGVAWHVVAADAWLCHYAPPPPWRPDMGAP